MNIFIVGSPWHAVVARALIENKEMSDPVFIIEKISATSLEQILNVLSGYDIHAIYSHEETRFVSIRSKGVIKFVTAMRRSFDEIGVSAAVLRDKVNTCDANTNIYYFNFYSPITRRFLQEFKPASQVNFFRVEDGVCDYFPFNFMNYGLFQRLAKAGLAFAVGKYFLYSRSCAWLFKRTSAYYLFFPEKIELEWGSKQLLSLIEVKDNIRRICSSECVENELVIDEAGSSVLLLGQTLYEDGICSLEMEVRAYSTLLRCSKGVKYFKPHPRTCKEKIDYIEGLGFIVLHTDLSAEYLMSRYNFRYLVGMWSNSIIYSRKIFSIPSYSLTSVVLDSHEGDGGAALRRIHKVLQDKFVGDYCEFDIDAYR